MTDLGLHLLGLLSHSQFLVHKSLELDAQANWELKSINGERGICEPFINEVFENDRINER